MSFSIGVEKNRSSRKSELSSIEKFSVAASEFFQQCKWIWSFFSLTFLVFYEAFSEWDYLETSDKIQQSFVIVATGKCFSILWIFHEYTLLAIVQTKHFFYNCSNKKISYMIFCMVEVLKSWSDKCNKKTFFSLLDLSHESVFIYCNCYKKF